MKLTRNVRRTLAATFIQLAVAAQLVSFSLGVSAADQSTNIEAVISSAKTKADHEKIAAFYEAEATSLQRKLEQHKRMNDAYKRAGHGKHGGIPMGYHCTKLLSNYADAIAETLELARGHRAMAEEAAT